MFINMFFHVFIHDSMSATVSVHAERKKLQLPYTVRHPVRSARFAFNLLSVRGLANEISALPSASQPGNYRIFSEEMAAYCHLLSAACDIDCSMVPHSGAIAAEMQRIRGKATGKIRARWSESGMDAELKKRADRSEARMLGAFEIMGVSAVGIGGFGFLWALATAAGAIHLPDPAASLLLSAAASAGGFFGIAALVSIGVTALSLIASFPIGRHRSNLEHRVSEFDAVLEWKPDAAAGVDPPPASQVPPGAIRTL